MRARSLFLAWGRQEPGSSDPGSCPWHRARCSCHCCSECLGPQPLPPRLRSAGVSPRLASPTSPIPPLAPILALPKEEDAGISPGARRIWIIYSPAASSAALTFPCRRQRGDANSGAGVTGSVLGGSPLPAGTEQEAGARQGARELAGATESQARWDPSLGKGGIGFLPPRPHRTNSSG